MEVLKRVKKVIDELLLWVIIFLFLMMFGITNLNVIMRYFFNSPDCLFCGNGTLLFRIDYILGSNLYNEGGSSYSCGFFHRHVP